MATFYKTSLGQVVLSRSYCFGTVTYKVSYARDGDHSNMITLGSVYRMRGGAKWAVGGDMLARTYSTRRAAIEMLQKAAA